jgi:hypothetical protein
MHYSSLTHPGIRPGTSFLHTTYYYFYMYLMLKKILLYVVYYQKRLSEKQYQQQQSYAIKTNSTCFKKQTYFIVLCI